jgi:membrane protein DedA with SNARE-associated domain
MINFKSRGVRRVAVWLSLFFILPTTVFALRSYGSFRLLRSAYEAGAPKTSSIRAWMTVTYIAGVYHVPATELLNRLGIPSSAGADITLKSAAEQSGVSPYQYVQQVQRIIAAQGSNGATENASETSGWLRALGDQVLSALLVYGYPVLGLSVLLGTVGLPLPQGLATLVAGSLAAQGRMSWIAAGGITVIASVLGDAFDYGCGVLLGREILRRYGGWFGFTPSRLDRVHLLFERWGVATIFVTRTFISYLSSSASLLAGVSHYRLSKFLSVTVAGRVLWASAYLGLGYIIGTDLEAASAFLTNLSLSLFFAFALILSAIVADGHVKPFRQGERAPQ